MNRPYWNIQEIRKILAQLHERGYVGPEIVDALIKDGVAAPVECEIFDYKETQEVGAAPMAKLVRHIASFYNSYGGYLLFGVREAESEQVFEAIGVHESLLDLESLKAKTREFLGERIQISGSTVPAAAADGRRITLFVLYIPKRPENGRPPLHFYKDAPGQIFRKDEVYCRVGDECVEAKGPKLFALSLARLNPYLKVHAGLQFEQLTIRRIQNNLPDRNFVCSQFIGRETYLDTLWRWLADDLSHVKMLAGEGGLGKSSIAYEFADRLAQVPGNTYEQVVWLTAKRRQFVGQSDSFVSVPETHYSTYQDLVTSILNHLPVLVDKQPSTDIPIDELKRLVRDGLTSYPSFIVVDDIDSLDAEEQRKVVELGLLIGSVKSKLLLTTRHNHAYSADLATQITGFEEPEFSAYLDSLFERKLLSRDLSRNQRRMLLETTQGSPLFIESVCRLLRFQSFEEAIKGWESAGGTRVRAAALDREVTMLSPEAKRVLLAAVYFGEASVPEIAEATEFPQDDVHRYIQDLNSLFLLADQTLGDQPRFSVPENTYRLVIERASTMATDYRRLENRVKTIRNGPPAGVRRKGLGVGQAISQAQAQARGGDLDGALQTIDDAIKRLKRNADLLGVRSELLMKFAPPRCEEARQCARDAFNGKCRRRDMFHSWFDAEWEVSNFVGAAECARAALDGGSASDGSWWVKLAGALRAMADDYKDHESLTRKIRTYFEASKALRCAIRTGGYETRWWETLQCETHDNIWALLSDRLDSIEGLDDAVEALEAIWKAGDSRYRNASRAVFVCRAAATYFERLSTRKSESAIRAVELRFERARKLVDLRVERFSGDARNEGLLNAISGAADKLGAVTGSP